MKCITLDIIHSLHIYYVIFMIFDHQKSVEINRTVNDMKKDDQLSLIDIKIINKNFTRVSALN